MPYDILRCKTQSDVLSFLGAMYHRGKTGKPETLTLRFPERGHLTIIANSYGLRAWMVSGESHHEIEIEPDIMSSTVWYAIRIVRGEAD